MTKPLVRGLKSIVLTSSQPDTLAAFYRDVLQLPFEKEKHKGVLPHWACQFGALHYAIHDSGGFWLPSVGRETSSCTFLSFTIEDLGAFRDHLAQRGVNVLASRQIGPMDFVTIADPDGRQISCGTPWPGSK